MYKLYNLIFKINAYRSNLSCKNDITYYIQFSSKKTKTSRYIFTLKMFS